MSRHQKPIVHKGKNIIVEFDYYAREIRNIGHPDNRLPDVLEEIDIISVSDEQVDWDWVEQKIMEDIQCERLDENS